MKFKNLKLRVKSIGAVVVLVLLLVASVSNVPANTVIVNDQSISDDSGTLFNFTNDWLNLTRANFSGDVTAGNITLSGNITASYIKGDGSLLTGISGGGGDYDLTKIWNSNGNNYTTTGAHIQDAINDLDNNSGMVWLPGNTTITTSSTIKIYENIRVDMQWSTVKPDADFDVFSLHKNAQLVNGKIDANYPLTFTSAAILFDGANEIGNSWYSGYGNFGHTYVGNMILQGNEVVGQHPEWMNGTAIKMICDHNSDGEWIIGAVCDHIDIHSFKYGIHLYCPGGSTGASEENYINGNYFSDIDMMQVRFGITTDRNTAYSVTDSSIYGNQFENIVHQVNKCTDYAIHTEGDWNEFEILIWDWGLANDTTVAVTLDTYCNTSILQNLGGSDYIVDNGNKNYVWNRGAWEWGGGNAPGEIKSPLSYNFSGRLNTIDGDLWAYDINRHTGTAPWNATAVRFFYYSSGTGPMLYIYGGTQSTDYLGFRVRDTYAEIIANEHIVLDPAFDNFVGINITVPTSELHVLGTTTIDDILKLDGRTTDPSPLSDGMIWHNTTTDLLYCRLNSATYTFNLTAV